MLNTAQNGIGSMELRGQAAKRLSGGARSICPAFPHFNRIPVYGACAVCGARQRAALVSRLAHAPYPLP